MYSAILQEIERVDEIATRLGRSVSFFGSARISEDASTFCLARQIARDLARLGYTIISGGGPGIMRAAIEGAHEAGGPTVGFNISLPFEPLDVALQDISLTFDHFFTRKLAFARCSDAFVAMPGGMGTLDELFDILTLIQTRKLKPRPVVLVGKDFWHGLLQWMREQLAPSGLIAAEEVDSIGVFDDPRDVVAFLRDQLNRPQPMSSTSELSETTALTQRLERSS